MLVKKSTKMKLQRIHLRAWNAISFTNYIAFIATTILVLISAHAKSAQIIEKHGAGAVSGAGVGVLLATSNTTRNNITIVNSTSSFEFNNNRQNSSLQATLPEIPPINDTNGIDEKKGQRELSAGVDDKNWKSKQAIDFIPEVLDSMPPEHHQRHQHHHHHQHQPKPEPEHHHRHQHQHHNHHNLNQNDNHVHKSNVEEKPLAEITLKRHSHSHNSHHNLWPAREEHNGKHIYRSKFSIEELLNTKFERKISNDIDMDPCKAGGFMGDIALPDVAFTETDDDHDHDHNHEDLDDHDEMQNDSPLPEIPTKLNATFQRELEILKKEVYQEGLQVEEEGLTDIIKKKTKLPSKLEELNTRHHNDPIQSANEPVKPTSYTSQARNLKNEVIGLDTYPAPDYTLKTPEALSRIRIFEKEYENLQKHTYTTTPINKEEKPLKPVTGVLNRNVDIRKIQSNTKDIEDDSGNNFVSERKVIIVPTTQPVQPRSTLPNVFSNAGGNGMKPEDLESAHEEKPHKRRHRRGRNHRRSSKDFDTKVQRLRDELGRHTHTTEEFLLKNEYPTQWKTHLRHQHHRNIQDEQRDETMHDSKHIEHQEALQHHHLRHEKHHHKPYSNELNQHVISLEPHYANFLKTLNYSSESPDDLEVLTKRKITMDALNAELHSSLDISIQNAENLKHLEKHHRMARAVTAKKERVWDYGVIPYEIDGNFSGLHKTLFKQAMRHWENFTCIKFVERDPEIHPDYIVFTIRNCGCCSFVGKRGNGAQAISIGRNCDKFGIVVHELGHVVGFWHEHTRPDREKHVVIELNNIMKGQDYNFNMLAPEEVDSLGMAYDYDSIMHYARNTFSKGTYLDTILPIEVKGKKRPEIGQRLRLSAGDIAQANLLYKCPKCGRTFQDSTGIFASPTFYHGATNNETESCEWRITATHGERVQLNFSLNLFESKNCKTDYLEIRDGYYFKSPLIGRFCGKELDQKVITESSRMLLTYVNNHRSEGFEGFTAEYEVKCGGDLMIDENEGRLESPNYPLEYLASKNCVWKITVPENYQVALKFQSFEVENHDNCVYDYLEVRDGPSQDSEIIGVFCGYKPPPNMKSTGNQMYVKFVSDSSVQKAGFSAIFMKEVDECETKNHGCEHKCINTLGGYECSCHIGYELHSDKKHCEDACGGLIEFPNGTITSPSFPDNYPVLKECIWEIIAPANHRISLNFTHFDLEGTAHQQSDCGYDSVTIYSKLNGNRLKRIGTYCGTSIPPQATSETNALRIEFHSDKSVQQSGFAAVFFTDIDECAVNNGGCQHECHNTIGSYFCSCHNGYSLHENGHDCKEGECKYEILGSFGHIYSPNYPDNYPPNADCVWRFQTTPGHRIKLIFNEFHIESHQECAYDNVAIYDGESESSSILGRFCGDKIPYPISSSTNQLYMVLKTDKNKQMNGFAAVHSTSCGGYLRAKRQIQQFYSHTLYANKNYQPNTDCEWTIQAPATLNVQLMFLTFDLEPNENCSFDYVQVYSGMEESSGPLYGQYCGNTLPMDIISMTDSLLIRFKTDDSLEMKGFSASYVAVDPYENSDEEDEDEGSYSLENITPFPGSLKSIYKQETEENEDYSDLSENHLVLNGDFPPRQP